jgi:hypothetical protein
MPIHRGVLFVCEMIVIRTARSDSQLEQRSLAQIKIGADDFSLPCAYGLGLASDLPCRILGHAQPCWDGQDGLHIDRHLNERFLTRKCNPSVHIRVE